MDFVYVVSLVDEYISRDGSVQYVIGDMTHLDEVRNKIKQKYNIEFEEEPAYSTDDYYRFNDNADRYAHLIVKRINIIK